MIRKVRVHHWIAAFVLFNRNTLNNRSIFFHCKNGSDRYGKEICVSVL